MIRLTGGMTTDPRSADRSPDRSQRRGSTLTWVIFFVVMAVLGLLAVLPWILSLVLVALYGLGGSGSNK